MRTIIPRYIIIVALLFGALSSCDEGDIITAYDTPRGNTRVVLLTGRLVGADTWPDGYTLSLAGFKQGSEYSVITKNIFASSDNGTVSVTLSDIPDEVTSLSVCVVNRIRQKIAEFASIDQAEIANAGNDTIHFDVGTLSVSMFTALQDNVFTPTCSGCHGKNTTAAAGLNLTEGKAYAALIGKPSSKIEGLNIVEPGDTANSVLNKALFSDVSSTWHYNHTSEIIDENVMKKLLIDWILSGAKP